jgi:hypothetical protein
MEVLHQSKLQQWKSNVPRFLASRDFRRLIGIEGTMGDFASFTASGFERLKFIAEGSQYRNI